MSMASPMGRRLGPGLGMPRRAGQAAEPEAAVVYPTVAPSYLSVRTLSTATSGNVRSICVRPDGGAFFYLDTVGGRFVREHLMSPAFNVASGGTGQVLDVSGAMPYACGLAFRPDGTQMFIFNNYSAYIHVYNLPTPWDLSSAQYVGQFPIMSVTEGGGFSDDGMNLYYWNGPSLRRDMLASPWAVGSITGSTTKSLPGDNQHGAQISGDGLYLYYVEYTTGVPTVRQHSLSTPFSQSSTSKPRILNVKSELGGTGVHGLHIIGGRLFLLARNASNYPIAAAYEL